MPTTSLDLCNVRDWSSFHDVSARAFGFPDFYGRNMDAWIDCLSYLEEGDGMCGFKLAIGEHLEVRLPGFEDFAKRCPEICTMFLICTASVNLRYQEVGDSPRVVLVPLLGENISSPRQEYLEMLGFQGVDV